MTYVGFESPPAPPVVVRKFPEDVNRNPLLAAAGFYPDGWAALRTSMRLSQPPGYSYLSIRGEVPLIGDGAFSTDVRVRVDGRQIAEQTLRVGRFDIAAPVPEGASSAGGRQVELEFSRAQQLPSGDGRAVAARLTFIGLVPQPLPPARLERFPEDLKKPLVEPSGVYDDGWVGQTASFKLSQSPETQTLTVAGMVPRIGDGDGFTTDLIVMVDGSEVGRRTVGLDRFTFDVPVPPPTSAEGATRKVELRFTRVQTLPGPDGRVVGARLSSVGFDSSGN
jgi:hypothetical protein